MPRGRWHHREGLQSHVLHPSACAALRHADHATGAPRLVAGCHIKHEPSGRCVAQPLGKTRHLRKGPGHASLGGGRGIQPRPRCSRTETRPRCWISDPACSNRRIALTGSSSPGGTELPG